MTATKYDLENDGVEGYEYRGCHPDVNGKWGGHKAIVSHYAKESEHGVELTLTPVYIFVGDYWEVGQQPSDSEDLPTRWEIAKLVTEAMQNGIDRKKLHKAIYKVTNKLDNYVGKEAL